MSFSRFYRHRISPWGFGAIGNAFASRAKDWEFESLRPHFFNYFAFNLFIYNKYIAINNKRKSYSPHFMLP